MGDGSGGREFSTELSPFLSSHPVLVIGTTCKPQDVPTDVQTAFLHEVKIEALSEDQRRAMLSMLTACLPLGKEVSLAKLARRTAVSETTVVCGEGQPCDVAGQECWANLLCLAMEERGTSHSTVTVFSGNLCSSHLNSNRRFLVPKDSMLFQMCYFC